MEVISTIDFIKKYKHVEFEKMSRTESNPNVRLRLLGLHHLISGKNRHEAAACVGKKDEWLRMWVIRYHNGGYDNLFDREKSGCPSYLTKKQEQELVSELVIMQDKRNGGRITAKEIQLFVNEKYQVDYKMKSIYDLLERIGMSWVSSRSKHPKADEKKQNDFKKTFKARVIRIAKQIARKKNKKKDVKK